MGLLFPPSIIVGGIVGGLAGGLGGHQWKGMSRADVKELGEALDAGDAALIVLGSPALREQTERILSGARRRVVKPLDVKHHEFAAALAEAEARSAAALVSEPEGEPPCPTTSRRRLEEIERHVRAVRARDDLRR